MAQMCGTSGASGRVKNEKGGPSAVRAIATQFSKLPKTVSPDSTSALVALSTRYSTGKENSNAHSPYWMNLLGCNTCRRVSATFSSTSSKHAFFSNRWATRFTAWGRLTL